MKTDFAQGVFQQIGAQPQKVSWGETFTALQSGMVDGAEAATYGFYEQKHFEIADYLSLTGHVYTPSFLLAAKSFMDSLTAGQRAVFIEVGRAITERGYEISAALERRYFNEMTGKLKINAGSAVLGQFLANEQIPQRIASGLGGLPDSFVLRMLLINVFLPE